MGRIVEIKEGGQRIGIEAARAIVRSVAIGAMQGDLRKQKLVLQIAAAAEQSSKADRAESIKFVTFYKAKFDPIFSAAAKAGKAEPEQLPHPDHLGIDLTTGEMIITGPLTLPDKQQWDHLKFQLRETSKILKEMLAAAAAKPRDRAAAKRVVLVQQHLTALEREVRPGWNWAEELGWEDKYAERILAPRTRD